MILLSQSFGKDLGTFKILNLNSEFTMDIHKKIISKFLIK